MYRIRSSAQLELSNMGVIWCFVLGILIITRLHISSAQPGFVSIDCGTTGNFTDPVTNITWMGDDGFILTGSNVADLQTGTAPLENDKQMKSLRFFDDSRTKHCYVLPVDPNWTYLIRAMFLYSNYDKKAVNPVFDLAIDGTMWTTIDLTASRDVVNSWFKPTVAEVLVPSSGKGNLSVCLIRKSPAYTPFISSLELRPVTSNAYTYVKRSNNLLQNVGRFNCGPPTNTSRVRYPEDPFDRLWLPTDPTSNIPSIRSSKAITSNFNNAPPFVVLQSAWAKDSGFSMIWNSLTSASGYYAYLYFASDANSSSDPSDQRILDISVNGSPWWEAQNVTADGSYNIVSKSVDADINGIANFTFTKAPGSALGPILNAAELYAILAIVNASTFQEDVEVLNVLQTRFRLEGWSGDPCSPVPWDWLGCSSSVRPRITAIKLSGTNISGQLPQEVTQLRELTDLLLDGNKLTGIPDDFTSLVNLERVHLQNNLLTGVVPASFTELHQLKELFLENNFFNGTLPDELMNTSSFTIRVYGNPYLCVPYQWICRGEGPDNTKLIVLCASGALALVLVVACLIFCCRRRRKLRPINHGRNRLSSGYYGGTPYEVYSSEGGSTPVHPVMGTNIGPSLFIPRPEVEKYTYEEIRTATDNFKTQTGEGVIGPVYQGQLPDGKPIAVITLSTKSGITADEYISEVAILSKIQHKNLVCLVGYCDEAQHRMLIYEHMAKGTVRDHLYGKLHESEPINWKKRLEICLSAARGLQFLHTQCAPRIIHGDVKSSNIFLTGELVAKVAEFGLTKLRTEESAKSGYMNSEFSTTERLTTKSDVFNFGIVLLESICGRKTAKTGASTENTNIIQWVKSSLQDGNIHAIVDPTLADGYDVETMWHVAELALLSTEARSVSRPTMTQVVRGLVEALEIESGTFVAIPQSINSNVDSFIGNGGKKEGGRSTIRSYKK